MVGFHMLNFQQEKHDYTIYNNDSHVVGYDGNIYFINHYEVNHKMNYALSYLPIDFDQTNLNSVRPINLIQFRTVQPGEKLKIDSGMIFYQYAGNTYYYRLEDGKSDRFCEGNLQYLDMSSNRYVTLYKGSLYEGRFFSGTYNTYEINQLTTSNMVKMEEDKDNIYYYAAEKKPVLVGLRKSDFAFLIYDIIDQSEYHLSKIKLTNKEVIELLESGDSYYSAPINIKSKEKGKLTLANEEEVASFDKNPTLGYIATIENEKIALYENGNKISEIPHDFSGDLEISLNYVEKIKNSLYYDVTLKTEAEEGILTKMSRFLIEVDLTNGNSYQVNTGAQLRKIS